MDSAFEGKLWRGGAVPPVGGGRGALRGTGRPWWTCCPVGISPS